MYKIADFRKNMRQAFEDSNQGHEVLIERYGYKYQLVCLVDAPLPGQKLESIPDKSARLKEDAVKLCKHGFPPTFCKYAKNGKPCK